MAEPFSLFTATVGLVDQLVTRIAALQARLSSLHSQSSTLSIAHSEVVALQNELDAVQALLQRHLSSLEPEAADNFLARVAAMRKTLSAAIEDVSELQSTIFQDDMLQQKRYALLRLYHNLKRFAYADDISLRLQSVIKGLADARTDSKMLIGFLSFAHPVIHNVERNAILSDNLAENTSISLQANGEYEQKHGGIHFFQVACYTAARAGHALFEIMGAVSHRMVGLTVMSIKSLYVGCFCGARQIRNAVTRY